MGGDERDLVKLTDCHNPVEAGALREYLQANGVFAYVQGENHSSMLGAIGSIMIELNVLVQRGDLDEARDLLEAFTNANPISDEDWAEGGDDDDDSADLVDPPQARLSISKIGKNPVTAAMLGIVPSFGFAHYYTGAFIRGGLLAVTEVIGIMLLGTNLVLGIGLIASAMFVDIAAGAQRASELRGDPELPPARVLSGKK
jgi:hypothetical protein